MNIFKPRNLKKMIWIFILFVFAETANAASIISTAIPTLVPQKADQIQRSSIHEGQDVSIGPMRKIFDMDLIGDGKTEKFKLESKTGNISDSEINSELKVQRIMSSGELETIGRFSYPDVGYVQVDIAPLNSQTPKKSFLIVNCRMGSVLWDLHVYQWDGKKFLEVESEPYLWGHPKTMRDGINAILVFSPGFIPKGPDIYIFQKGCLVPSNYHYPEIYESDIKEIYKVFSDKSYQPSQRIQICTRDLMKFLYGGKVKEGIQLAKKIEDLSKQISYAPNNEAPPRDISFFRAYADLEMGQKTAGLKALKKLFSMDSSHIGFYSALGEYFYFKNDFKTALKYYVLADDASFDSNSRVHLWAKRINLLRDLLKD